jgi:response regulator RpfG family c-di-GMP phosphodiesterase
MHKKIPPFIIIDDDIISNMVSSKIIKNALGEVEINTFHLPSSGLEFIKEKYSGLNKPGYSILFLDVDMPEMSGWEFLEQLNLLDKKIRDHIRIIMFSASLDVRVAEKAMRNKSVSQFIPKPLRSDLIERLFC